MATNNALNNASTSGFSSTGGAFTANGGTVSIGTDNASNAISIGVGSTARTIGIGNSAAAHVITIGSTTGAASLTQNVGTGNFVLDGTTSSTYTVGASTTTGTITIGGTAQTGTMTLGSSSGTNIINIGNGSGATTLNLVNTQTAGALNVGAAMTTGTITIGGTGAQTGTITFGGGTGAQTVNIGTGGTGVKTIHIGDSAVANVITVGSTTGAASLTLQSGSGNIVNNAGFTVDSTGRTKNAVQPSFYAYKSGTATNATGDGTTYTIICDTALANRGSYYDTGTGAFTAPVTGLYLFSCTVALTNLGVQNNATIILVLGGQIVYTTILNPTINAGGVLAFNSNIGPYPLTATNTAVFQVQVSGSTKTVTVYGGAAGGGLFTQFGGYLVC